MPTLATVNTLHRSRTGTALLSVATIAAGLWLGSAANAQPAHAYGLVSAAFNAERLCTSTCTVNVPAGGSLHVRLWGAGGGGGGSDSTDKDRAGGGGGAGGYVNSVVSVGEAPEGLTTVPVTITVGLGGLGGRDGYGAGVEGGATEVTVNGVTAAAYGGAGGRGSVPTGTAASGAGGDGGDGTYVPYTSDTAAGDKGGGYVLRGNKGADSAGGSGGTGGAGSTLAEFGTMYGSGGNGGDTSSSFTKGHPGQDGFAFVMW
jgi:hypothetical protein